MAQEVKDAKDIFSLFRLFWDTIPPSGKPRASGDLDYDQMSKLHRDLREKNIAPKVSAYSCQIWWDLVSDLPDPETTSSTRPVLLFRIPHYAVPIEMHDRCLD